MKDEIRPKEKVKNNFKKTHLFVSELIFKLDVNSSKLHLTHRGDVFKTSSSWLIVKRKSKNKVFRFKPPGNKQMEKSAEPLSPVSDQRNKSAVKGSNTEHVAAPRACLLPVCSMSALTCMPDVCCHPI